MTSFDEDLAETWAFILTYTNRLENYLNYNNPTILNDDLLKILNNINIFYQQEKGAFCLNNNKSILPLNEYQLLWNKITLILSYVFLNIN